MYVVEEAGGYQVMKWREFKEWKEKVIQLTSRLEVYFNKILISFETEMKDVSVPRQLSKEYDEDQNLEDSLSKPNLLKKMSSYKVMHI